MSEQEVSEQDPIEVIFSVPFLRRLKGLAKKYRKVRQDLEPVIDSLKSGDFQGDRIVGLEDDIFVLKTRAKNSDIPTGKSGGYRVIYQVKSDRLVLLLLIYAKSDQVNVSLDEIREALVQGMD
jgi:mRNA-degrading endonuclease RelE of RelBE toxin-antitoxin system